VKTYLGVTDMDWIRLLRATGDEVEQANFWNPGGTRAFRALQHGELFLFKTHAADGSRIVGGGIFDAFVFMRVTEAWETFHEQNGVVSLEQFRERVLRYRRTATSLALDAEVGCTLLRDLRFFDVAEQLPSPPDFSPNIVQGRSYDLDTLPADHPVLVACALLIQPGITAPGAEVPWELRQRMFGDARLHTPRLGQAAFKAVIAENYHHHCAITGDKVRPVLQAAHIRPVSEGGAHRSDNGMLLRSDMHTLFDAGYIAVDAGHRLRVSPLLREEFGNGDALYAKAGSVIDLPERPVDRPNAEFLEWHLSERFKASA
jgi:putative restriction endonuclease